MSNVPLDSLRRRLQDLAVPDPPPGLLQRILESRASHLRVALPRPRVGPGYTRWVAATLTAAAALALVIRARGPEQPAASADYQDITAALSFWPRAAMGQQAGSARAPRYDLVRQLDASRAQEGTWTYSICTTTENALTKCSGRLTIMVREARQADQPAWLMTQHLAEVRDRSSTKDTIFHPPETTYFAQQTLRPLSWWMTGRGINVVRRFTSDSLYEAVDITGPHPRSWRVSARLPGTGDEPLVLRWARFDITPLLQALPLDRGWRGSVYSVGLIGRVPSASPFAPLDLRVVGSERIDVPAGRFDCWRIEMRIGDESVTTLWASKGRGLLIKMEERWSDMPDLRRDYTLISATPPAP